MKSYDEMANNVLSRIREYETEQNHKKKLIKRAVISLSSVCIAVLIGIAIWNNLSIQVNTYSENDKNIANGSTYSPDESEYISNQGDNPVFIPKVKLPETSNNDIVADIIGLVVYKGNIYTQTEYYYGEDDGRIKELVGEYLGYATGKINEWSSQDDYAKEFASTYEGNVYSVNGYSTDFRICMYEKFKDEDGNTMIWLQFMEKLNDIELTYGNELFGDRLQIKGRISSVQYQEYYDWNEGKDKFQHLSGVTQDELNAFVEGLYSGKFEYVTDFSSELKHTMLYLRLDDYTTVELELIEGGYVRYQYMGELYYVKMSEDAFNPVFNACINNNGN